MKLRHQRALAAVLSTMLGLSIAVLIWPHREAGDSVELVDIRQEIEVDFAEREAQGSGSLSTSLEAAESTVRPLMVGNYNHAELPEELARKLFPSIKRPNKRLKHDPLPFYWGMSQYQRTAYVRGHPDGEFLMVNSTLGFRRATDVLEQKPDLRVIVTGDSHTEGVVPMPEHLTELCEDILRENNKARTVEVINAGVGGYSFFNYKGVAEKFKGLKADIFVVAIYGGNDFVGNMRLYRYFNHLPLDSGLPKELRKKNKQVRTSSSQLFAQFLNQALKLHYQPDVLAVVKTATAEFVREMNTLCQGHGSQFVLMYIPSLYEVQPQRAEKRINQALDLFGLEYEDLHETGDLADAILRDARQLNVPCVDLREPFRAATVQLYWAADHHINTAGHAVAARELAAVLEGMATR